MRPTGIQQDRNLKEDILDASVKSKLPPEKAADKPSGSGLKPKERAEDKPSSSGTRPKEVVESVPVQNQAAAQKLLQKLNQPNQGDRHHRGRRHRGKGQEDDEVVFTLEEYEKRKAQQNPSNKDNVLDISRDEDLAWQLQNQFNLEHSQVQSGPRESEADNIRMSMFTYEKDSDDSYQMGRGRGR
ncbi:tudor domain-containing protein 3-like, partial [Trifolium medium]|nr:tudor domain-containing protein 3-like [Trifolium medium]